MNVSGRDTPENARPPIEAHGQKTFCSGRQCRAVGFKILAKGVGEMPISWSVDHAKRMVRGTAHGMLCLKDVEDYLDGMLQTATLSYGKMLDLSQCASALSMDDVRSLGSRLNSFQIADAMGPAAIVVGSQEVYEQVRAFGALTAAKRPLKVFRENLEAEEWLLTASMKAASIFDSSDGATP